MSGLVNGLARDFRLGLRTLTRRPAHAIAVVLTLAIGIGANTAIFSVINALLLQPLPYANGEQLAGAACDASASNGSAAL